jgi:hypothetical protein
VGISLSFVVGRLYGESLMQVYRNLTSFIFVCLFASLSMIFTCVYSVKDLSTIAACFTCGDDASIASSCCHINHLTFILIYILQGLTSLFLARL